MVTSTGKRLGAALGLLALAVSGLIPAAHADAPQILDKGHVDAFNVVAKGDGLELNLKEDVTGSHVQRAPESVILKVNKEALSDIPAQFPGAPRGYLLPMTQADNLVWPGWDTLGVQTADSGFSAIDLTMMKVEGPGKVYIFQSDFSGPVSRLKDQSYELKTGAVINQDYPAHTHVNWVFSKAGTYTFQVQASGMNAKTKKIVKSNVGTYTFQVGDAPEPSESPTATPTDGATKTPPTSPAPSTSAPTTTTPATPPPAKSAPAKPAPLQPGKQAPLAGGGQGGAQAEECVPTKITRNVSAGGSVAVEGHFDLGAQLVGGQLQSSLKDDRRQPASWVNPSSLVFHLSDAAKMNAPDFLSFVVTPGSPVWFIGSSQKAGVPWLGQNTQHPSVVNGTTGPVTWRLVSVKGPGKMAVFNSGPFGGGIGQRVFDNVGGPTSYQIPANTHSHPNWVFTQPGAYHVTIEQTATTKAGAKVSSTSVLHFAVGVDPKTAAGSTTIEEWVGKTASGKDCVLSPEQIAKLPKGAKVGGANANMPQTGSQNQELALATVTLLLAGCTILMVRRRVA